MTNIPATLRRLAAHFDENDPSRKPGRRAGTTISPYACDFEIDEAELRADLLQAFKALGEILMKPEVK